MLGNMGHNSLTRNLTAKIAALPMIITASVVFLGGTIWTFVYSFTSSGLLPQMRFVGLAQYVRLMNSNRWIVSLENLVAFGLLVLSASLFVGFLLAALLDQRIRLEAGFRTLILYPFALSYIVTGLVWQWILNPDMGLQRSIRQLGWESFSFDPLNSSRFVVFALMIAGMWHITGLVMVIMLAGLRGIDDEVWKATKVDGIPIWKTYLRVVIPMMKPVFVTCIVLISADIIKIYDLVVAMTNGGPGIASELPAKYVYDSMFQRQNLGQAFAASTVMLLTVLVFLVPWALVEFGRKRRG
jgi:glucose/mannose transport system permease protein